MACDLHALFHSMDIALQHPMWTVDALSSFDVGRLLAAAQTFKRAHGSAFPLRGKHVALLSDNPRSATALAFADAVTALGASLSVIPSQGARIEDPLQGTAAARMLGRLYDAIGCDASDPAVLAKLARESGVPVLNLPDSALHPMRLLADLLTIQESGADTLVHLSLCVVGDEVSPAAVLWRHLSQATGLQVHTCLASARPREMADADFVFDPEGERCSDGHPALWSTRRRAWLGDEQVANQRFTMQALLAHSVR
jgi:ornithine carbamoyltransferase